MEEKKLVVHDAYKRYNAKFPCPFCHSFNTVFDYANNNKMEQPRFKCKDKTRKRGVKGQKGMKGHLFSPFGVVKELHKTYEQFLMGYQEYGPALASLRLAREEIGRLLASFPPMQSPSSRNPNPKSTSSGPAQQGFDGTQQGFGAAQQGFGATQYTGVAQGVQQHQMWANPYLGLPYMAQSRNGNWQPNNMVNPVYAGSSSGVDAVYEQQIGPGMAKPGNGYLANQVYAQTNNSPYNIMPPNSGLYYQPRPCNPNLYCQYPALEGSDFVQEDRRVHLYQTEEPPTEDDSYGCVQGVHQQQIMPNQVLGWPNMSEKRNEYGLQTDNITNQVYGWPDMANLQANNMACNNMPPNMADYQPQCKPNMAAPVLLPEEDFLQDQGQRKAELAPLYLCQAKTPTCNSLESNLTDQEPVIQEHDYYGNNYMDCCTTETEAQIETDRNMNTIQENVDCFQNHSIQRLIEIETQIATETAGAGSEEKTAGAADDMWLSSQQLVNQAHNIQAQRIGTEDVLCLSNTDEFMEINPKQTQNLDPNDGQSPRKMNTIQEHVDCLQNCSIQRSIEIDEKKKDEIESEEKTAAVVDSMCLSSQQLVNQAHTIQAQTIETEDVLCLHNTDEFMEINPEQIQILDPKDCQTYSKVASLEPAISNCDFKPDIITYVVNLIDYEDHPPSYFSLWSHSECLWSLP